MSTCVNVASQQLMKRPGPAGERKPLCLPGKNLLVRFFCFFDMTVMWAGGVVPSLPLYASPSRGRIFRVFLPSLPLR